MRKTALITDLGNTLFDWLSVWYHSFNAMLNKVVEISGFPEDELIAWARPIHQKYDTVEYSFILENIPLLQEEYDDRSSINLVMDDTIRTSRSKGKKYLSLYQAVMDTLSVLKSRGCYIVAYTEPEAYYSNFHLARLGLDNVIDVLFSPEGHEVPDGGKKRGKYNLMLAKQGYTPIDGIKPSPQLPLDIIKSVGAIPEECVYIGDSEMRDIEMAQKASVSDVLTSYGMNHFEGNKEGYELLRAITHWIGTDVERERKIKENALGAKPTYVTKQFSDILSFFRPTKLKGK